MPESVLTILKFCFLALLYLFLFRVVRVVVKEMRAPAPVPEQPAAPPSAVPVAASSPAKPAKGRGPGRLRILEPPGRQGESFPLTGRECGRCSWIRPCRRPGWYWLEPDSLSRFTGRLTGQERRVLTGGHTPAFAVTVGAGVLATAVATCAAPTLRARQAATAADREPELVDA